MPHFQLINLLTWFHFLTMAIAGGAMVVSLLISGMEEDQDDFRGLSALIWKKVVTWSIRLTLLLGIALMPYYGDHAMDARYLWFKLPMVIILVAASESATKPLIRGKRGAALMAFLMFLLASLVTYNKDAFGVRRRPLPPPGQLSAAPEAK